MAAFRTLSLALGIGALASISAFGQSFTCTGKITATNIRGGGVTEPLPTIAYTCTVDDPDSTQDPLTGQSITVDFADSVLGITNQTMVKNGKTVLTGVNLRVDGAIQGDGPEFDMDNHPNQIKFNNVAVPNKDLGASFLLKVEGLRVAVPEVASQTVLAAPLFTDGEGFFNFGEAGTLANIWPAFAVSTTKCDGVTPLILPKGVQTCSTSSESDVVFGVQVAEGFATAFKTKAGEGTGAATATRIQVTFKNIPANVTLYVSQTAIAASPKMTVAATPDGTNGDKAAEWAKCGGIEYMTPAGAQAKIQMIGLTASKGVASAVYDITASNSSAIENFTIGVSLKYTGGAVSASATGTDISVSANMAPEADAKLDIVPNNFAFPSFSTTAQAAKVPGAEFAACGTTLLFPYVNSGGGYETGIAIVNTGKDASGALSGKGACSLNFFGSGAPTTAVEGTKELGPGDIAMFNVGEKASNFAGYLIANCNFQYAHGLAYSTGPAGVTEYLGLVINADRDAATEGDRQ